ncbi:MAG: Rdx family protein [bacterium]|nr:Rdx family protein [bacterium]
MADALTSRYGLTANLVPSSGGVFEVTIDGELVFSKKARDRFPDHAEVFTEIERRR